MSTQRPYDDIPGTYVFDGARSRRGYRLNKLCMSLNHAANRESFSADEDAYCERFDLPEDQREAIRNRDWLTMLKLGGNIYYTFKLAAHDGLSMQDVGAKMSGVSTEEFKAMLLAGGRRHDG